MRIHKNNIYDTFRCKSLGKNQTLNEIIKGTKSVLASENGFKKYINNYSLLTRKPTLKNRDLINYPLQQKDSAFLVPIKNGNISEDRRKIRIISKKKIFFSNEFIENNKGLNFREKYNKRFYHFLRIKTENSLKVKQKKINDKRIKRYNTLFLDFFNKWNDYDYNYNSINISNLKNYNNIIKNKNLDDSTNQKDLKKNYLNINISKFNIKDRYLGLNYDENEIFNSNYNKFILNKIEYIRKNKIKNYIDYLESNFTDLNEKEIQLKLESIKLTFIQKMKNNLPPTEGNNKNYFEIFLPLSYVFLFYYNDFHFFQKILMSILYFEKDCKTIKFNDKELYNLLNTIKINNESEENKEEKDIDYLSRFQKSKKSINSQNILIKGNRPIILDKKETYDKDLRKTFNKNNNFVNKLFLKKNSEKYNSTKKDNLKIKIIHSNIIQREKYFFLKTEENKNDTNLEAEENTINKKETFYNEYYFIWETPIYSYKVKLEMPKIYFSYEDIEQTIISFCDKNLFLFLYKQNFINWDFYVLNYIFSIKSFREFILHFFSVKKNSTLSKDSKIKLNLIKNLKTISFNKTLNNLYNKLSDEKKTENKNNKYLFLQNKKIYNQISEKNESYSFFYSDLNQRNYILHFYSYNAKIEYKKLNPKLKWEFYFNFKQMRILNEVTKYEQLLSFLPKIIKTNFEYGQLDIDFSVFNNFNQKILSKDEIEFCILNKNNEIKIDINRPYIEMEKIFKDDKNIEKKELNYESLRNLNKIKMSGWTKTFLKMMNLDIFDDKGEINKEENFNSKFNEINENIKENNKNQNKSRSKNNSKQKLTYIGNKGIKNKDFIIKSLNKYN